MSRLGVWVVSLLNRLVPTQAMHRELAESKLSVEAYQAWEYREIRQIYPEFGSAWDLCGKRLLDVGCGLGGKSVFYAESGCRSVTAIDLRFKSVQATRDLARDRCLTTLEAFLCDAAHLALPDNYFDVIISVNVLEHVDDLLGTLRECKRVLRPGGLMLLHFPPFYSPWGAHLDGWVNFPWPHVFFSDATLIEVARQVEAQLRRNQSYIPSAQVDWERAIQLPELNRATVKQVLDLISELELEVLRADMLPPGRFYLARRGPLAHSLLGLLRRLAAWPPLREYLTTKMVFVLRKGQAK
ncbi:MAG: class I SAM-dependent methyltransferase [Thermoflexales bacterium]|nr:class I SAM-dependent methyltransferase [Thermoflexales bacterium]